MEAKPGIVGLSQALASIWRRMKVDPTRRLKNSDRKTGRLTDTKKFWASNRTSDTRLLLAALDSRAGGTSRNDPLDLGVLPDDCLAVAFHR
ncbi:MULTISPECIES: hypothetical protein [Methylobacterium]|uniref:Uncharacterized protein n=1 Tax=Methylobacterium thuringiense TaxID=1003091 RepID=A0ABQ4TRC6_9HYPH|nr:MULTISPECIES: hypothetical protein [Methylobacterium]TXN20104.1 hypothetical protein FV217_19115 [Methylobacterium sp. WL9]GJE57914.1 hypothetical protein EKPJFOCH_4442 [Methylobacterium thuringiense]